MSLASDPSESIVDSDVDVPEDPDRVFAELVERNDRVCRNCYVRLERSREYPARVGWANRDVLAFVDERLPEESEWAIADLEYHESEGISKRKPKAYPPGESSPTRYCAHCGTYHAHRTPTETRSKREAVDVAANVSMTLEEYGVAHDWLLLVAAVKRLKTHPDYAGDDFETFRRAVARAVAAV